ncbi:hypothetical protein GQ457_14G007410 [Hibiscus cannabinus]
MSTSSATFHRSEVHHPRPLAAGCNGCSGKPLQSVFLSLCSSNSHSCVTVAATFQSITPKLDAKWSDLKDPLNSTTNLGFWEYEWTKHEKCSDYPNNPLDYFDYALKILEGLPAAYKFASGKPFDVQYVINVIYRLLNAKPEIACNMNINIGKAQLWEIRLCFQRPVLPGLIKSIWDFLYQLAHDPRGRAKAACQTLSQKITIP